MLKKKCFIFNQKSFINLEKAKGSGNIRIKYVFRRGLDTLKCFIIGFLREYVQNILYASIYKTK